MWNWIVGDDSCVKSTFTQYWRRQTALKFWFVNCEKQPFSIKLLVLAIYNHCPILAVAVLVRKNDKLNLCDDSVLKTSSLKYIEGDKRLLKIEIKLMISKTSITYPAICKNGIGCSCMRECEILDFMMILDKQCQWFLLFEEDKRPKKIQLKILKNKHYLCNFCFRKYHQCPIMDVVILSCEYVDLNFCDDSRVKELFLHHFEKKRTKKLNKWYWGRSIA